MRWLIIAMLSIFVISVGVVSASNAAMRCTKQKDGTTECVETGPSDPADGDFKIKLVPAPKPTPTPKEPAGG